MANEPAVKKGQTAKALTPRKSAVVEAAKKAVKESSNVE